MTVTEFVILLVPVEIVQALKYVVVIHRPYINREALRSALDVGRLKPSSIATRVFL